MTLLATSLANHQQPPINQLLVSSLEVYKNWDFHSKIIVEGRVFVKKSFLILGPKKKIKTTRYTVLCRSKKVLSFSNYIKSRISNRFRPFQWCLARKCYRSSRSCNGSGVWWENYWIVALRRSVQKPPLSLSKWSVAGCWKKLVDFSSLLRRWYLDEFD